ncbi:hypothetical protein [Mucilaginibacter sp.]|uniref:hypothetical protein n=1 Tax=Mucilaginibacter sp. TaxID=1882438 RepID=UPI00262857AF|nr:hypothetical protein [Mucilaginibacter sp.]MDB4926104.1 hypothetical protein [Mucilaginibacter sp.]
MSGSNTFLFIEGAYYITIVIVYITILGLCIFKTDWIIDKLQLDKGYNDERFEFNIHRSTILKIVVMVIGGLLIADSFPLFCQQLLAYFQQSNTLVYKKFTDSPISKYIVFYLLKTFIGFFMLTCSRMIVNYIELKRKKADLETAV